MQLKSLETLFENYREKSLSHRYIHNDHIVPLLKKLPAVFKVSEIGKSVNELPIYSVTFGSGSKKLLFWSQMHGNESTTSKALFDVFNLFGNDDNIVKSILEVCTIIVIPILNPDGAKAYTRLNANEIDLNRDAQDLSQPESKVLREVFNNFKPHFCFNLHGQRTIFSSGQTNNPATVSFLAPAQDAECTITSSRKKAMEVIAILNNLLQEAVPNQVGIYDDAFNINCVGDTFQSENVPTILFEAGHYREDYARDKTRVLMFMALVKAMHYIANTTIVGIASDQYFVIPENKKCFYDVIIRNALIDVYGEKRIKDIAIQFQEVLKDERIVFVPKVEKITDLQGFYGHKEIDASNQEVSTVDNKVIYQGYENDFVLINNELLSVK